MLVFKHCRGSIVVRLQVFCSMNNNQKEQNRDYMLRCLLFFDVYSFIAVKILMLSVV